MNEVERFQREYYTHYVAHLDHLTEEPIALIHAIVELFSQCERDDFDTSDERFIRDEWNDPAKRAAMEEDYEGYLEVESRKLERMRDDPLALIHAINKATNEFYSLTSSAARSVEAGVRYEWRDNPARRVEMEQDYEESLRPKNKADETTRVPFPDRWLSQ